MTADAKVFVGCCFIAVFFAGLVIGKDARPYVCPVSPGETVVSTIDSKVAQVCVYARNIYGRSVRKMAAVKS